MRRFIFIVLLLNAVTVFAARISLLCPNAIPLRPVIAHGLGDLGVILLRGEDNPLYLSLGANGTVDIDANMLQAASEFRFNQAYFFTQGIIADGYCPGIAKRFSRMHLVSPRFQLNTLLQTSKINLAVASW